MRTRYSASNFLDDACPGAEGPASFRTGAYHDDAVARSQGRPTAQLSTVWLGSVSQAAYLEIPAATGIAILWGVAGHGPQRASIHGPSRVDRTVAGRDESSLGEAPCAGVENNDTLRPGSRDTSGAEPPKETEGP